MARLCVGVGRKDIIPAVGDLLQGNTPPAFKDVPHTFIA